FPLPSSTNPNICISYERCLSFDQKCCKKVMKSRPGLDFLPAPQTIRQMHLFLMSDQSNNSPDHVEKVGIIKRVIKTYAPTITALVLYSSTFLIDNPQLASGMSSLQKLAFLHFKIETCCKILNILMSASSPPLSLQILEFIGAEVNEE